AKGQPLAQMEDRDLQNAVSDLKARLTFAAAEGKRAERLLSSGSISRAEAQQARANWESAKAALARAEEEAAYMRLTAPADAIVIKRDGEVGQFIPAAQEIFWLSSLTAPLRITTEVDEEDIALVQPGQKVVIRADAFEGQVFHGTVQTITPKGDPIARSYRVRVSLPENSPLRIGMTAETNIIISERENALLVPSTALRKDTLWQIVDGKLVKTKVQTGARAPDKTEITEGLDETATVVLNPTDSLKEGDSARTRAPTELETQPQL
ncbi:MAG: efflux RND transporter periplasmic adaptor subunit, partial [Rickettsiales bacterium]|nr:efflux RND transporter periplasmic adaptor subunit [Rickettsiales bacterium]